MREFRKELREKMESLKVDQEFARRYVNDGFSGGESKRAEILQMAMLRPNSPFWTRPTADWTWTQCD